MKEGDVDVREKSKKQGRVVEALRKLVGQVGFPMHGLKCLPTRQKVLLSRSLPDRDELVADINVNR